MKVAIVFVNNIRYSPYVKFYANLLVKNSIEFELIYPNRNNITDEFHATAHIMGGWSDGNMLRNYYAFRTYCINTMKNNEYDFVIALTTITAVILSDFLIKYYKGKYLVDIRDYTHENNWLYYFMERRVIKNSALNIISSDMFRKFLPFRADYILCHNTNMSNETSKYEFKKANGRIVIAYIGTIAYAEQCIKLIKLVQRDDRFVFYFYGNEMGKMLVHNYIQICNSDRIRYFGPYKPQEKERIILDADILFNAYGNKSVLLKYALSNKLYDSIYYKKLVLTSPETYMNEILKNASFAMDFGKVHNLDNLFNWYHHLNRYNLNAKFNEMQLQVTMCNEKTEKKVIECLTSIREKKGKQNEQQQILQVT